MQDYANGGVFEIFWTELGRVAKLELQKSIYLRGLISVNPIPKS